MRGSRSTSARRSMRAFTAAGLAALASLGASASPAAAAPAVSTEVRNVTTTSASICATGIRPAVVTQFGVYDGEGRKIVASTARCNTVSGLLPSTRYIFVFKSGRPGEETTMLSEGEVAFTTAAPEPGQVVARAITSTSVEICKTYVNVAAERAVVYRQISNFGGYEQAAESTDQCTTVAGLDPSRTYTFTLKVGNPFVANEDLRLLGGVTTTTLAADGNPARATIAAVEPRAAILCAPETVGSLQGRYVVFDGATPIAESLTRCVSVRDLVPATRYSLDFRSGPTGAPDAQLQSAGTLTFTTLVARTSEDPRVTVRQIGRRSAVVCGEPNATQVLMRWAVFESGTQLNTSLDECVLLTGLTSSKTYSVELERTTAGAPDSTLVSQGTVGFDTLSAEDGPTHVDSITPTSAVVYADDTRFPPGLVEWSLYAGDRRIASKVNPSVPITGLAPDTTYSFTLRYSFDGSRDTTSRWADVTFRTLPAGDVPSVDDFAFDLAGTAALKTLTTGSLPLSGSIAAQLDRATGAFNGPLTLARSEAKLTTLGFLPVVAKVDLVAAENVTGSLREGTLEAVAKVRIKLPSVKVLGIELAGGANCQARQISSIALRSTGEAFLASAGGPIAGTFSISNLTGCGFLTNLVSPLTSGAGNAIALSLTPKRVG
ncbi:MAG: hypothetical protein Q7T55_06630 [Solirubrobacteraceae bacterium]|nr:hypothetical protein [Solirubrobacteraceae bacterium]